MPIMEITYPLGELDNNSHIEVLSYMIHPDQYDLEEFRKKVQVYYKYELMLLNNDFNKDSPDGTDPEIADILRRSPPPSDMQLKIRKSFIEGKLAGEILIVLLVCASENPEFASVNRVVSVMEAHHHMSKASIMRAWSHYKRVSHLWAAYFMQKEGEREGRIDPYFCIETPQGLFRFLSFAEALRKEGENHFAPIGVKGSKQGTTPTFKQDELWRAPDHLKLSTLPITYFGLPEGYRKALREYRARKSERNTKAPKKEDFK